MRRLFAPRPTAPISETALRSPVGRSDGLWPLQDDCRQEVYPSSQGLCEVCQAEEKVGLGASPGQEGGGS